MKPTAAPATARRLAHDQRNRASATSRARLSPRIPTIAAIRTAAPPARRTRGPARGPRLFHLQPSTSPIAPAAVRVPKPSSRPSRAARGSGRPEEDGHERDKERNAERLGRQARELADAGSPPGRRRLRRAPRRRRRAPAPPRGAAPAADTLTTGRRRRRRAPRSISEAPVRARSSGRPGAPRPRLGLRLVRPPALGSGSVRRRRLTAGLRQRLRGLPSARAREPHGGSRRFHHRGRLGYLAVRLRSGALGATSKMRPSGTRMKSTGVAPLDVVVVGEDRLARLGERRVDRVAVGERRIELSGEDDRGAVRDLELHRDDGRESRAARGSPRRRRTGRRLEVRAPSQELRTASRSVVSSASIVPSWLRSRVGRARSRPRAGGRRPRARWSYPPWPMKWKMW